MRKVLSVRVDSTAICPCDWLLKTAFTSCTSWGPFGLYLIKKITFSLSLFYYYSIIQLTS